jgi:hypothetical protein
VSYVSCSFIEKNFVDPVGCDSDDPTTDIVTCNGLQAWDGVMADGGSALASSRKQGAGTSPNADQASGCAAATGALRGMMDVSCWGKLGFNLGKRMTGYMSIQNMPKLLEWYSTTMVGCAVVECSS